MHYIGKNQNQNDTRKKVILLDELPARFLFTPWMDESLDEYLFIKGVQNVFVVACVSPVIANEESSCFKERLKKIDEKNLLETKNILFKQLDVSYRNSFQIQGFYNVFLAHYNQLSKYDCNNDDYHLPFLHITKAEQVSM